MYLVTINKPDGSNKQQFRFYDKEIAFTYYELMKAKHFCCSIIVI